MPGDIGMALCSSTDAGFSLRVEPGAALLQYVTVSADLLAHVRSYHESWLSSSG
jgi:hypothetical protein